MNVVRAGSMSEKQVPHHDGDENATTVPPVERLQGEYASSAALSDVDSGDNAKPSNERADSGSSQPTVEDLPVTTGVNETPRCPDTGFSVQDGAEHQSPAPGASKGNDDTLTADSHNIATTRDSDPGILNAGQPQLKSGVSSVSTGNTDAVPAAADGPALTRDSITRISGLDESDRHLDQPSNSESNSNAASWSVQIPQTPLDPWARTPTEWQKAQFEECKQDSSILRSLQSAFRIRDPDFQTFFEAFAVSSCLLVGSQLRMVWGAYGGVYLPLEDLSRFQYPLDEWRGRDGILLVENCGLNLAERLARRYAIPFSFFMGHWLAGRKQVQVSDVPPPQWHNGVVETFDGAPELGEVFPNISCCFIGPTSRMYS
jgi:hypothetical protein